MPDQALTTTRALRALAVILLPASFLLGCPDKPLPAPRAGLFDHGALGYVAVPGGVVDAAGGNLVVRRTDLSLETHIGSYALTATHSSASRAWRHAFEMSYAGDTFVDGTGAVHGLAQVPFGAAVPGTTWVRESPAAMKTKGGLVHAFDAAGRLEAVYWASDPGRRLRLLASELAPGLWRTTRIEQCEDASAGPCTLLFELGYDASARLVTIDDHAGRSARFGYDAEGRLASARDALDTARGWPGLRYEYDAEGRIVAVTSSEGERVEYAYVPGSDRAQAVVAIGEGDPVYGFAYTKLGTGGLFRTTFTDPTGVATVFTWDGQRRVRTVLAVGVGEQASFEWSGLRVARSVAPDGTEVVVGYDGDDPASLALPSGNVVSLAYDRAAVNPADPLATPVAAVSDLLGPVRSIAYDAAGRPEAVANGEGESVAYAYDAAGRLARVTSPQGVVTEHLDYGDHGFATRVERDGEVLDRRSFDPVGNLRIGNDLDDPTATSSGAAHDRRFDEDRNLAGLLLWGHVTSTGGPGEEEITVEYRSDGRPTAIRRPFGGDFELVHDALGRVVERRERVDGVWRTTSFAYDLASRLVAVERPNGMRTELGYDAAGRLETVTHRRFGAFESSFTRVYAGGRLVQVVDSERPGPETYHYDAAGRVARVDHPDGEAVLLGYDLRSRVTSVVYLRPDASVLRSFAIGYDGADRQLALTDTSAGETLLEHAFALGRLQSIRYGNGLERVFAYDPGKGALSGIQMRDAAGELVEDTAIFHGRLLADVLYSALIVESRDALGLVPEPPPESPEGRVRTADTYYLERFSPTEGSGYRLASWCKHEASCGITGFEFDTQASLAQGWAYPQEAGAYRCFAYNPERNRLLAVEEPTAPTPQTPCASASALAELRTYAWDEAGYATAIDGTPVAWTAHGRVAAVGSSAVLRWDAQGRLVASDVLGVQKTYRYGGSVEADALGTPVSLDLGAVEVDLVAGDHRYRHFDFRMNVILVTDQDGHVVSHRRYGPYGLHQTFGLDDDDVTFAAGRQIASLMVLGARAYDPLAGRFLSPDPIFQLINQYAYTKGNPIWFGDPGGTSDLAWRVFYMVSIGVGSAIGFKSSVPGGALLGAILGFEFAQFVFQTFNPGEQGYSLGDVIEFFNPLPPRLRRSQPQSGGPGPGVSNDINPHPGVAGLDSSLDTVATDWGRIPIWIARHMDLRTGNMVSSSDLSTDTSGPGCAGTGGSPGSGGNGSCGLGTELAWLMVGLRCAWIRRRQRLVAAVSRGGQ